MFFAVTPTDRRDWPRCTECGRTVRVSASSEPQPHVCESCGTALEVSRSYAGAWSVRAAAPATNALEVANAACCA
jgi:ribosomal protein L37AE/L43A